MLSRKDPESKLEWRKEHFNEARQLNGNSFYLHEVNINYLIKKQPLVHTVSF